MNTFHKYSDTVTTGLLVRLLKTWWNIFSEKVMKSFFKDVFIKDLFIWEREGVHVRACKSWRRAGGDNRQADPLLSGEPAMGLSLMDLRSWLQAKPRVQCSTYWATQMSSSILFSTALFSPLKNNSVLKSLNVTVLGIWISTTELTPISRKLVILTIKLYFSKMIVLIC